MKNPEASAIAKVALFSTLLFFAIYAFVPLRFAENDDVVMMLLSSGRYTGEPSTNLVFINYHISSLLSYLYETIPSVEWYPVAFITILSISISIPISISFDRVSENNPVGAISLITILSVSACFIISMQFTTVSAISTSIGMWAILSGRSKCYKAIGVCLLIFGFLLRFEAAALAIFVSSPFAVYKMWNDIFRKTNIVILGLTILASILLHAHGEYNKGIVSEEYLKFNNLRGKINDNPNADISSHLLPEKISENDFQLFLEFFPDPGEFSVDDLLEIQSAINENVLEIGLSDWKDALYNLKNRPELCLIVIYIIILAVSNQSSALAPVTVLGVIMLVGPMLYVSTHALLKWRVIASGCISSLAAIYFLNVSISSRILKISGNTILIFACLNFMLIARDRWKQNFRLSSTFLTQSELIERWPGKIYAFKNHYAMEGARIFTSDFDILSRRVILGGWMVKHPDNPNFSEYLDLLHPDAAVFFAPGPEAETGMNRIILALKENHNVESERRILFENPEGMLVGFRRK